MNPTNHKPLPARLTITCSHCGASESFTIFWQESWQSIINHLANSGWSVDFPTPIPSFSCPLCASPLYDFPHRHHKKTYDDPAMNVSSPEADPIID